MKLFCVLTLAVACLAAAVSPQLKQVNTVYILGMSGGLDQFLATRLSEAGVFQVVTDPQKADAILTDRLGEPFENKLQELYPPPAPPKDPSKSDEKKSVADMGGPAARVTSSSFNRAKGNLFLVDRKTRVVLWSIYEPPKDSSRGQLSKTAGRVVKHLMTDLGERKPGE